MTLTAHAEHAFSPRPGDTRRPGNEHAILNQPIIASRYRRDAGDALCKPRRAFWGLQTDINPEVTCPRCLALAGRYGVTLPREGADR
jgi:hypothetical protein